MGVGPAEAGIASGLINTSHQVGGAIAVAVATTLSAQATESYVENHPGTDMLGAAALTHGYELAFYVFAGVAALAAVVTALMLESKRAEAQLTPTAEDAPELGAA
jgi:sugar phosphate permease